MKKKESEKQRRKWNKKMHEENTAEYYLDPKTSMLPKWLLERGITCHLWDCYEDIQSMKRSLSFLEKENNKVYGLQHALYKKMDRRQKRFFNKKFGWELRRLKEDIKKLKDEIANFRIIYFRAEDIEKLYKDTLNRCKVKDIEISER